jgi:ankyrin repeat protein
MESFKCLQYMLSIGESPNQICNLEDKSTPLHFSVLAKNMLNTKIILGFKGAPNAKDSFGNTPYHYAVQCKMNILWLIEEHGGDGTLLNDQNLSPIDLAFTDGVKEAKAHFMALSKYKDYLNKHGYK